MGLRPLLIAHSSRAVTSTVKRHVLSELSDVTFTEAISGREALEHLKDRQFEVVISENEFFDMDGRALYKKMQDLELNKNTPFVILTPADVLKKDYIDQLDEAGIEHFLTVPFTAKAIIDKMNSACNPRSWRVNDRLNPVHLNL